MKIAVLANVGDIHGLKVAQYLKQFHQVLSISEKPPCEPLSDVVVIRKTDTATQYLKQWKDYAVVLNKLKPDVIHAVNIGVHGVFAYRSKAAPYVSTVMGTDLFKLRVKPIESRKIIVEALQHANAITVDSDDLGRLAKDTYRINPARIHKLHMGVDLDLFKPPSKVNSVFMRKLFSIQTGPVILSIRKLYPQYHHELIIEAFANVIEDYPDAILLLHGKSEDKEYVQLLKEHVNCYHLDKHVRWTDWLPYNRMPELICLSDVVVSMAETDGTAVSIMEAFACGVTVVASNVPAVREWVKPGETGYVSDLNSASIAAGIRNALQIPIHIRKTRPITEKHSNQKTSMQELMNLLNLAQEEGIRTS